MTDVELLSYHHMVGPANILYPAMSFGRIMYIINEQHLRIGDFILVWKICSEDALPHYIDYYANNNVCSKEYYINKIKTDLERVQERAKARTSIPELTSLYDL